MALRQARRLLAESSARGGGEAGGGEAGSGWAGGGGGEWGGEERAEAKAFRRVELQPSMITLVNYLIDELIKVFRRAELQREAQRLSRSLGAVAAQQLVAPLRRTLLFGRSPLVPPEAEI